MGLWLALILCVALSAFFSATETAYSASNRIRLKTLADGGKDKARLVLTLLEKYDSLLTTVLVGNNIVNIAGTAIATILFTKILNGDESGGATLASVVMTVVVLFLGEVGPKTMAKQAPEGFAMAIAPAVRVLMAIMTPADFLFRAWRRLCSRFVKADPDESQIEDELMTIIDEAQTEGDLEEEEGELLRSAIEFNEQDASDIMTPRVDVTAIEDTATVEDASQIFRDTWFSRIPVYHEDLDHVVGILNEKDFYAMTHDGCTDITKMMKEPVFAPASLPVSNLLQMFRSTKTHQIIVLDEFGGTDGIVTLEDVLEELVGEIYDEHDEINEEVVENEDGSVLVDGGMQLQELLEKTGVPDDDFDADTVGGWVSEMLEKVPELNDSFGRGGWKFTVTGMDGFRVTKVLGEKTPEIRENENGETE